MHSTYTGLTCFVCIFVCVLRYDARIRTAMNKLLLVYNLFSFGVWPTKAPAFFYFFFVCFSVLSAFTLSIHFLSSHCSHFFLFLSISIALTLSCSPSLSLSRSSARSFNIPQPTKTFGRCCFFIFCCIYIFFFHL